MRHAIAHCTLFCTFALAMITLGGIASTELVWAAPIGQASTGVEYIVQPGDSLSHIALMELGDAKLWQQIVEATNAKAAIDGQFTTIADPRLLRVGQRLWIPTIAAPVVPEPSDPSPIIVHDGLLLPQAEDGRLYGYVDTSGQFQIPPRYVIAGRFSEGLAVVSEDGINFGYIDSSGEMVIPAQFSNAGYFSGGLAPVQAGSTTALLEVSDAEGRLFSFLPSGYINTEGEYMIPPEYVNVEPFRDGLAIVYDIDWNPIYLDATGRQILMAGTTSPTLTIAIPQEDVAAAEVRAGSCENLSNVTIHPAVWRCQVEDTLFDPCFAPPLWAVTQDETSLPIVCNYPRTPFEADRVESSSLSESDSDVYIPQYWLRLDGAAGVDCVRTANDLLPVNPPVTHQCADGSVIVDKAWEAPGTGVWMARTYQMTTMDDSITLTNPVLRVIHELHDFGYDFDEPSVGAAIPPTAVYWQY